MARYTGKGPPDDIDFAAEVQLIDGDDVGAYRAFGTKDRRLTINDVDVSEAFHGPRDEDAEETT